VQNLCPILDGMRRRDQKLILDLASAHRKVYGQKLLRLNRSLKDKPQSNIDLSRVLPFRDSRLKTPTHFKTLISLGSSAPRPGAPIGNLMLYALGHKGTMAQGTIHHGEQSLEDQESLLVTLIVSIMIDRHTCE
jgi:hypothetical protein